MYLANGSLLTGRYKHFHDFLVRHFLDVHSYYVVIYFNDIYYALMIFGGMHIENGIQELSFQMVWVGEQS